MSARSTATALLWAAIKRIPDGEDAMRGAVERMNDADGTNAELRGTPEYRSTKRLSDAQLQRLAQEFRRKAGLPAPSLRREAGPKGGRPRRPEATSGVSVMATAEERDYIRHLCSLLEMSEEGRQTFIARQTRRQGLTTHRNATAVIAPLERMLTARGWTCVERNRIKTWQKPETKPPATASGLWHPHICCTEATRINCVCMVAFTCSTHGTHHIGTHD